MYEPILRLGLGFQDRRCRQAGAGHQRSVGHQVFGGHIIELEDLLNHALIRLDDAFALPIWAATQSLTRWS